MGSLLHLLNRRTGFALDGLYANLVESFYEEVAVFCVDDGLYRRPQYFDAVFLKDSLLIQLHAAVQGCLSTKREQDAIRTFLLDDTLHEISRYWLEIHRVGHILRGLYCSDIRIDQHRVDAFFLQGFQRLCSAIVELSRLSYLQCTATQQQHFLYLLLHHPNSFTNSSNKNSVSTGPLQASGWNWTENQGCVLWRMPSLEPSFIFTNSGSQSAGSVESSTA